MKKSSNPQQLKYAVAGAGVLAAMLRTLLYATGTDEKGLLATGHWAHAALWALTLAVAVALVVFCRHLRAPEYDFQCYPPSAAGAMGCLLCAAGLAVDALFQLGQIRYPLDLLTLVSSAAAAVSLGYVGLCRMAGRKPVYLGHALVCICFALRMVSQYRTWSSDPQLMDYCFLMAALVGLMLTGYHLAAFDAGFGRHQPLWFIGLASVYLCLAGLYRAESPLLLILCAIWVLTNLPRARWMPPALDRDTSPQKGA